MTGLSPLTDPRRLTAVFETRCREELLASDLQAVVGTLSAACAVPCAAVVLVSPGVQTCLAEVGIGASRTVVDDDLSLSADVTASGRPTSVADLRYHDVYWRNPLVQQGRVVAFAGEPLIDDGHVLGVVAILDDKPREFSSAELAVLRHQARLAGSVLELHRRVSDPARSDQRWDEPAGFSPVLHQAIGRLVARFSVAPAEAVVRLRDLAERLGQPLSAVASDVAAGNLRPLEDVQLSAVGPTADTDLVLLREHLSTSSPEAADGPAEGPA